MGNAKWGFLTKKSPQDGLKTMAHSTMQEDATDRKPGLPDKDGTLTRPIAPAASTSLPLLSPAVSQPYKIRCAE